MIVILSQCTKESMCSLCFHEYPPVSRQTGLTTQMVRGVSQAVSYGAGNHDGVEGWIEADGLGPSLHNQSDCLAREAVLELCMAVDG
jgi:hypothetical protein